MNWKQKATRVENMFLKERRTTGWHAMHDGIIKREEHEHVREQWQFVKLRSVVLEWVLVFFLAVP